MDDADILLSCANRALLERLYVRHLRAGRMILPLAATAARGLARVRIELPDHSTIMLDATIGEQVAGQTTVLRVGFEPLRAEHIAKIDSHLGAPASRSGAATAPARPRPALTEEDEFGPASDPTPTPMAVFVDRETGTTRSASTGRTGVSSMIPKVPDTSPEDFERESKILRLAERADYYNGVGLRDEYIRTLKRILELAPESERVWAELRAVESRPERKKDPEHEGLQGLFARTFKKDG